MADRKILLAAVDAQFLPDFIRDNTNVIVHVWAEWNPYNYQMDAWLYSLQSEFPEKRFVSLDTGPETAWEFLRQHQIMTLPTLVCFMSVVWYETYVGLRSEAELRTKLGAWSVAQAM